MMSTEQDIIERYGSVIKALIPYQQRGRLLEGLNRFSSRLSAQARNVIKNEVIRLTSQTDAPADNSAFAQFPVKKFAHFGITMTLDRVGAEILKRETARYLDQYTVGVFESITNSDFYKNQVTRKLRQKIIQAFTVQSQSYKDIVFDDDLSITPHFSVSTIAYQNGRSLTVVALSATEITVACTRSPKFADEPLPFTFPDIMGLCKANQEIHYRFKDVEFSSRTQRHHATLTLAEQDAEWQPKIAKYLAGVALRLPLERDLEIERTMQALDRDRIVENSPWIPVFLRKEQETFIPTMVMLTGTNTERNPGCRATRFLPGKSRFKRIMDELQRYNETYVFRTTVTAGTGKPIELCATLRELEQVQLLGFFIKLAEESDGLSIWQYRLSEIPETDRSNAMTIQDISCEDSELIPQLKHIVYVRMVNDELGKLKAFIPIEKAKLPKQISDADECWPLHFVMEEGNDRRAEPRYRIEKSASVKFGLLTSYDAIVRDFSLSGMQIELLGPPQESPPEFIKVNVPDLKMKGMRYQVLNYSPQNYVMRLRLEANDANSKLATKISGQNASLLKIRNIEQQQKVYFRYLWELASRNQPHIAIQVIHGRQMYSRLKTVYIPEQSNDLYPFKQVTNEVPLHGFVADMDKSPPDSSALKRLLQQANRYHMAIHCERKADQRLIALTAHECFASKLRKQIVQYLEESKVILCATTLECHPNVRVTTPMTKQRLALLSKVDMDVYEKLLNLQHTYSHVIHLIDISPLAQALTLAQYVPTESSDTGAVEGGENTPA
ncbi:PilZ domain-containing protein [Aestuariibacter sp. GS-14]|uniref:PilZ domain-containing protein n=1 Tax=Aestuariibacter sp. GS-14 TaxID=2590670 RepID=UPI00112DA1A0|nr:PilZ domain-containing protein [Aestuariibacter sp. GS-14]TPV55644.1 PilZ domain-containing protein [Aestuariibacter sp. GS-14]